MGVQLGIKWNSDRFVVITRINIVLEEMKNTWAWGKLQSTQFVAFHTSASIMCYSFVFALFETFIFRVSLPIFHFFLSRLLHQAKWKFPVFLKLKWKNWNLWHKFAVCTLEFWPGSTPYNGLHREAPPERGTFLSGFRFMKRQGFYSLKYMKG